MTRNGGTEVVRLSKEDWMALIGVVLTSLALVFLGAGWVYNVLSERMSKVEASDAEQNDRIRSNEKENEFTKEVLQEIKEEIKEGFGKMDRSVEELRKDLNTL